MPVSNPFILGLAEGVKPRPRQTVSEWAEDKLFLSSERSASPGPFRVGSAVYQRGMMDAVTEIDTEEIVFQTSSQVGKSTILGAIQGYYTEAEPAPQLCAFPTNILANAYALETFDPMIRDSPALGRVLSTNRKQTADYKSYPGGFIAFVGAQTPSNLAMRPIRVITGDEIDRFPQSSGKEGSPIDLLKRRTETFRNRKLVWSSTPVLKNVSAICAKYDASDKRVFKVFCPHCGFKQPLVWENVVVTKGRESEARYSCEGEHCGTLWDEFEKRDAVGNAEKLGGGWEATAPFRGIAGFYVSALYSPWSSMEKLSIAWHSAEGNPVHEQTFTNTLLGLPWDGDVSASADAETIYNRREQFSPTKLPARAGIITAGVDVQDDRIEVLYVGWGMGDESWLLDRTVIIGDPSTNRVWLDLQEALQRRFTHASGYPALAEAVAIDSGGHHTQRVYDFAAKHEKVGRRWHSIKGVPGESKPLWIRSEMRKKGVKLWLVGVDDAKSTLYARFGIVAAGPGFVHVPDRFDQAVIDQLTSEHAETEYTNGFPHRVWKKLPGKRNEMLDMAVYAMAARSSLDIDMASRLASMTKPEKPLDAAAIGARFR